ncbi:MAG: hypothetical protein HY675_15220 [Chloroflexi bacterium]|nr:hypothetical protein [Chloroflexota bacterium]
MTLSLSNRTVLLIALAAAIAVALALIRPTPTGAVPDYAAKTGEACASCHVNPAGGGALTDQGKAFQSAAASDSTLAAASAPAPSGDTSEATADESAIDAIESAINAIVEEAIAEKLSSYNADVPLWRLQSGTAPRMMELTDHFNLMWFAAQAGNWILADFEVYRSDETLKGIDVTRPARTAGLRAWWKPAETELREAVKAEDLEAFTQAYDRAIAGCNSCHVASVGGGISLKGVKVTRPTTPLFDNLDYAGN